MENRIIKQNKSIIPACDVMTFTGLEEIVEATFDLDKIGGYKIGFSLALRYGLSKVCATIRQYTDKPIIYDHQKAATDIPDTAELFARVCRQNNVDAVILFPFTGPKTLEAWVKAMQKEELGVIVGGEMTHGEFLASENGFISDDAPKKIFELSVEHGVSNFVVPGNKPQKIAEYKKFFEEKKVKPVFFAPGFVAQNGSITDSGKAAGEHWHAIVGRAITKASDKRKTAQELASQI